MNIICHTTLPSFEYYFQPKSVGEACVILAKHRESARVLAGGTDLIPLMRSRVITLDCVVDITRIPELDDIVAEKGGSIRIGALTRLRTLEQSDIVAQQYPLLHEAASQMATTEIRNMATIAGNLCRASPLADTACPLLALDASAVIADPKRSRVVKLTDFFLGPGKTVVKPDEIVIEIRVPRLPVGTGTSFLRITRVAADLAKVNVGVVITTRKGICQEARIALGAVSPTPIRARKAEELLKSEKLDGRLIEEAAERAADDTKPITDLRSTDEYRREVSKVLVRRALISALERAEGRS